MVNEYEVDPNAGCRSKMAEWKLKLGSSRSRDLWAALLLLALTMAVYANSLSGLFLGDSGAVVLEDPRVREVSRDNLGLIFTQQYWYPTANSGLYRPLVNLSFLLNYAVLGNAGRPAGYHWINLAFHAANVMLVWLLALTIFKQRLPAFFTAAIFTTHPVNVEAVTNIAGRADLMAAMGTLAALLLYTHLPRSRGWGRTASLLGIGAAAMFGLFSKENAAVLPALMLLYDLVLRSRPSWRGYLVVGAVLLTTWLVRLRVFSRLPPFDQPFVDNPLVGADFLTARLTALKIVCKYIWMLIWPQWLSWDYSYNQIPLATRSVGVAALAAVIAMLAAIIWLRRSRPQACLFGAFFFLALVPTSNLVVMIGSIMAERFLYLPSVGFAGFLTAAVLMGQDTRRARLAARALAAVVVGFGLRAAVRNLDWTDGERFWASAVEICPNSFKTHLAPIYGWSQQGFTAGNIDRAIEQGEQAVSILSGLPAQRNTSIPLTTLGALYRIKGDVLVYQRPEEIQGWYRKSLETLMRAMPLDQAYRDEQSRRVAARANPFPVNGSGYLYQNLGDTYRRLGRFDDALEAFTRLLKRTPLNSAVYAQIAVVDRELGRSEDAIVARWQAFAIDKSQETQWALELTYRVSYPDTCAPDRHCPMVKAHMCRAYEGLIRILQDAGVPRETDRFRRAAVQEYGCAIR
jgi:tetratricopeptide (TPR) repeat protein